MNTMEEAPAAPGSLPIFGHQLWLRWYPLRFLERQRAFGSITSLTLQGKRAYLVNEPDLVWSLLTEFSGQVGRGSTADKTRALTGNGLGSSDGEFHRQQRRLLQPAFHHAQVSSYVPLLRRAVELQASRWREGETLDLVLQMLAIAATGVLSSFFGVQNPKAMADVVSTALPTCLDGAARQAFAPVKSLTKLPTARRRHYRAELAKLRHLSDALCNHGPARPADASSDFLSILRDAHERGLPGLDTRQIGDEVKTMLVAGVETVATTTSWIYHLLSQNPASYRRVHSELERVLNGRPVEHEDLAKLDCTYRVVCEALRLFPPVWLVRRRVSIPLRLGEQHIPSGTSVYYSPYALHRDPRWYPAPERFDPDRWLPERRRDLPRGAYLPFGAGVHRCIGETFGIAEVMTILATLIPRWEILADSDRLAHPKAVVTLRPDRMPVTVRSRRRL
ncbi:cytochrome P450 [Amycolatopsis sp. lyj-90]|uniref:cytochrome P450 n=1 Tax=Amycolatopsis sp. lyj-90 TaxID=2789285 RepID=UPI00397A8620